MIKISLFHLIYSLADTIIVGKFLGGNTLAAVSVTGNATYLMFSIVSGINMGSSVVLAQAYGSGNREKLKRVIATSLFMIGWRVCCEPLVIPLYHCYV